MEEVTDPEPYKTGNIQVCGESISVLQNTHVPSLGLGGAPVTQTPNQKLLSPPVLIYPPTSSKRGHTACDVRGELQVSANAAV